MDISVYGPDYKQYLINYQENDNLEGEAYKLVKTLYELKSISRLPGELSSFYSEIAVPRIFVGKMPWVERRGVINRSCPLAPNRKLE